MSIENPTLAHFRHFRHFSSLFTLSHLYICRESSTNQLLFMQNKPNFQDAQMNVSNVKTKNYKNFIPLAGQKNKPNSNPIKPNSLKAKMNVNLYVIEDYRKKDDFSVRINKPNFRNGQNERKLTCNKGLQKKRCFCSPKNKPKTNPISNAHKPFKEAGKKRVSGTFFWVSSAGKDILYGKSHFSLKFGESSFIVLSKRKFPFVRG